MGLRQTWGQNCRCSCAGIGHPDPVVVLLDLAVELLVQLVLQKAPLSVLQADDTAANIDRDSCDVAACLNFDMAENRWSFDQFR